jgi:hypothetical protein
LSGLNARRSEIEIEIDPGIAIGGSGAGSESETVSETVTVKKTVEAERPACYWCRRWMSDAQNVAAAPSSWSGNVGSMVVVISQETKHINNQRTNHHV